MTITRLSSRQLNQNLGRAKRAAQDGPAIITDCGKPAHGLLSYAQYRKLSGKRRTLAEALALPPGSEDTELDLPARQPWGLRIPDFN